MSMMPGNPCHKDADFPYPKTKKVCKKCKGKKFDYDAFIDGTGPLQCIGCDGTGEQKMSSQSHKE